MKVGIYHKVYIDVAEALKRDNGFSGPVSTLDRSLWYMAIAYVNRPGQLWSLIDLKASLDETKRAVRSGTKDGVSLVKD